MSAPQYRPQHPQHYYPQPYYPPQQYAPQPYPQHPGYAVHRDRKNTSHGLHLFLTIITFGMWGLFVWLPLTIWHAWGPRRKSVTRYR